MRFARVVGGLIPGLHLAFAGWNRRRIIGRQRPPGLCRPGGAHQGAACQPSKHPFPHEPIDLGRNNACTCGFAPEVRRRRHNNDLPYSRRTQTAANSARNTRDRTANRPSISNLFDATPIFRCVPALRRHAAALRTPCGGHGNCLGQARVPVFAENDSYSLAKLALNFSKLGTSSFQRSVLAYHLRSRAHTNALPRAVRSTSTR